MAWKQSLVLALALAAIAAAAPSFSFGKGDKSLKPGFYSESGVLLGPNADAKDYSVTIGQVAGLNRLLMTETVYKEGIFAVSRDKDIIFPKKHEDGAYITGIRVLDQRLDGKNGKIRIKDGGVGEDHVKLRFDSQRGRDMNFVVEIFGRPDVDLDSSSSESVEFIAPVEVIVEAPVEIPAEKPESSSSESVEAPAVVEAVVEIPVEEEVAAVVEEDGPVAEDEPIVDASSAEDEPEPIVEESREIPIEVEANVDLPEEPVAEEPIPEEPVAEEPIVEVNVDLPAESISEEAIVEEPVAEEPIPEEPVETIAEVIEDLLQPEEPIPEEPIPEEPVPEVAEVIEDLLQPEEERPAQEL